MDGMTQPSAMPMAPPRHEQLYSDFRNEIEVIDQRVEELEHQIRLARHTRVMLQSACTAFEEWQAEATKAQPSNPDSVRY